jgi:hypothetical protein
LPKSPKSEVEIRQLSSQHRAAFNVDIHSPLRFI